MLVHEVMSTGLVTVKKTDTVRVGRHENDEAPLDAIPVVEGDIGMVTLRDVLLPLSRAVGLSFPRFENK